MIDAHHHLWNGALPWMSPPELEPLRRSYALVDLHAETSAARIDSTIVVQAVSGTDETVRLLAAAHASRGLIAGVVGWVDLEEPDHVQQRISELRAHDGGRYLVGIRHQAQDEGDPGWLLRPEVMGSIEAIADAGLAYDILVKGSPQLDAACQLAARLPRVRFVLDHLGKPPIAAGEYEPWATQISRLARCDNVFAKLSGLVTEARWDDWSVEQIAPFVNHALHAFGGDRLMWGSDWPVCTLAGGYKKGFDLIWSMVPQSSRDAIFGGTAEKAYDVASLTRPPQQEGPRI